MLVSTPAQKRVPQKFVEVAHWVVRGCERCFCSSHGLGVHHCGRRANTGVEASRKGDPHSQRVVLRRRVPTSAFEVAGGKVADRIPRGFRSSQHDCPQLAVKASEQPPLRVQRRVERVHRGSVLARLQERVLVAQLESRQGDTGVYFGLLFCSSSSTKRNSSASRRGR